MIVKGENSSGWLANPKYYMLCERLHADYFKTVLIENMLDLYS